jgi:thioesterase domain-containing protein
LCRIFAEALELERVGPEDNFFDLGGHSLLVLRVVEQVRRRLRIELRVGHVFEHPTPATLAVQAAQAASTGEAGDSGSDLIPLQSEGSGAPLYLVCPASGCPICYLELAQELRHDRPVYGLQAPGLLDARPAHTSVEGLAEHFRSLLPASPPDGAFLLGGWSFGATVAVELARILGAEGHAVCLFLIDMELVHPEDRGRPLNGMVAALAGLVNLWRLPWPTSYQRLRRLVGWVGISLPPSLRGLAVRNPRAQWRFLRQVGATARRSMALFRTHLGAARSYKLPPFRADTYLFKTGLGVNGAAENNSVVRKLRQISCGNFDIEGIPGNHMSLLEGTNRAALVTALQSRLDACALAQRSSQQGACR